MPILPITCNLIFFGGGFFFKGPMGPPCVCNSYPLRRYMYFFGPWFLPFFFHFLNWLHGVLFPLSLMGYHFWSLCQAFWIFRMKSPPCLSCSCLHCRCQQTFISVLYIWSIIYGGILRVIWTLHS